MFCCAHAAQVEAHLRVSRWLCQPGFAVSTIVSTDCLSAGDALRLVDQRNVVRGDFVLVSGDTVSNMSLATVLQEHRARRAKDKARPGRRAVASRADAAVAAVHPDDGDETGLSRPPRCASGRARTHPGAGPGHAAAAALRGGGARAAEPGGVPVC